MGAVACLFFSDPPLTPHATIACLSSDSAMMFTSLTILTLQTIIFASASTPGSGGYVPGFKVQLLVFRMFPRDDPSTSKSPTGKRFHSICCGLHNVCTGKPPRPHNCWLERTKVFLHFVFSLFFFTSHSGLPCSAQASCTFNISPSCFI